MKLTKALAVTLGLSASLFAMQANAALVTVTTTGTIGAGYDISGVFGAANTNLAGDQYTLSATFDPTLLPTTYNSDAYTNAKFGANAGASFTEQATVNGVTASFTGLLSYAGELWLYNYLTKTGSSADELFQLAEGSTSDGTTLQGEQYVYSIANSMGINSLDFNQSLSYTTQVGDVSGEYFYVNGLDGNANFHSGNGIGNGGTVTTISLNPQAPNDVPEPESLALVGVALVGLVATKRRRNKQAAA